MAKRDLVFRYLGDSKSLTRESGKAEKALKGVGKRTGSTGKAMSVLTKGTLALGAAFGAQQILKFGADAVTAFSDLEESVNAVNVVYGEAAEGVHDLGVDSADAFGLSTRAVNDAAVGLGAFVEKINEADPADAFKNIIERATDFGSVMNITTEETLEKFRAGLSGEAEPLKAFGLDLSAATVKQAALDAGIIKTGESMTETQKVQARYLTIMEQTEKTAGDFANTSDGLAGSQKILSAKWEEAQAVLGGKLAPAMLTALQAGTDLIPVFGLLVDAVGSLVEHLEPGIEQLGTFAGLIGELTGAASDGEEAAGGLTLSLGDVTDAVLTAIDPLGPLRDGMVDVGLEMIGAGEASETAAPQVELLRDAHELMEDAAARVADQLPITTGAVDDLAESVGEAEKKAFDAAGAVDGVATSMRKLIDPVFKAEEATDKFEETLERVQEDSILTQDELEELTSDLVDMRVANEAVTPENMIAYSQKSREALGLLDEKTEITAGNLEGLAQSGGADLARLVGAAGELLDKKLIVELRATIPSRAEMDAAVRAALQRARRRGIDGINF